MSGVAGWSHSISVAPCALNVAIGPKAGLDRRRELGGETLLRPPASFLLRPRWPAYFEHPQKDSVRKGRNIR